MLNLLLGNPDSAQRPERQARSKLQNVLDEHGIEGSWVLTPLRPVPKRGKAIVFEGVSEDGQALEVAIKSAKNQHSRVLYRMVPVDQKLDLEQMLELLKTSTVRDSRVATRATAVASLPSGTGRPPQLEQIAPGVTTREGKQIVAFAKMLGIPQPVPVGGGLYCVVATVTPLMGREWLKSFNFHNRSITAGHLGQYADDMARVAWGLHHQGLAFVTFPSPELCDGQTRLAAAANEDVSFETLITLNVPLESVKLIDYIRVRTVLDGAVFSGVEMRDTHNILSWAQRGFVKPSHKASKPAQLEFFKRHAEHLSHVVAEFKKYPKEAGVSVAPVKAAVFRAMYHIPTEVCDRFIECLMDPRKCKDDAEGIAGALAKSLAKIKQGDNTWNTRKYALTSRGIDNFFKKTPPPYLKPDISERHPLEEELAPVRDLEAELALV